jgi:hypothetical protein
MRNLKTIKKQFVIKYDNGVEEVVMNVGINNIRDFYNQGDLYIQRCISDIGFIYDKTFKEAKIGSITNFTSGDYYKAYDQIL